MAAVTTRAIAAESGVSIATLAHQFTNRERLLGVMAGIFGADLIDHTASRSRSRSRGILGFLPMTDDNSTRRRWTARTP
jgi:AcrR family transcriptional regulator